MIAPVSVVFDVNVLAGAAALGNSPYRSWPCPPGPSDNPLADCLGVLVDAVEFGLWLSPYLLNNTARVLADGLGWRARDIERVLTVLVEIAEFSGAGVIEPEVTVTDCADREDNHVLALAADVGAMLIVSDDAELTALAPWRGMPILRPKEFLDRVDGMRRHRRGR